MYFQMICAELYSKLVLRKSLAHVWEKNESNGHMGCNSALMLITKKFFCIQIKCALVNCRIQFGLRGKNLDFRQFYMTINNSSASEETCNKDYE